MAKTLTSRGIGNPDFVKDLREIIYELSSDKDLHFTTQLAKNAAESENLTGLRSDRIFIPSVAIQSDQQLHYQVFLFGTDVFEGSDIDLDRYVAMLDFDLTTYGVQASTGQYTMTLTSTDIDYEDLDKTKELHVMLKNVDPTTKNAGATGEVKLSFHCRARA